MRPRPLLLAALAAAALAAPLQAEKLPAQRSEQGDARIHLEIIDYTPRFLAFYEAARDVSDPARRFALWQEHYGFAAVPPGPRGDQMARGLLDTGWPRYAPNLPAIRLGAASFGTAPIETLRAIARILQPGGPLDVDFLVYVGAFEDNAFTVGGMPPTVAFPVEMSAGLRPLIMAHELTHAVHFQIAHLSGGWERSIGATLMQEGLAMHVAREVVPGRAEAAYIEHEPGWWSRVGARKGDILRDVLPVLASQDGQTVFNFTIGNGPAGFQREAYAVGWWVIEHLRAQGMTLAQIARIGEADMPAVAERAIREMLASAGS